MVTRLNPVAIRPVIEERKVKWLGTVGDYDYGTHDGIEYVVDRQSTDDPGRYNRQPGEVMISKAVREMVGGSPFDHHELHRALPVEPGTFADLSAKEAARKASLAQKPKPRPLDALAVHPLLRRQAASLLRTAPVSDNFFIEALSERPSGVVLPAHEQVSGSEAIVAVLRDKGVELRLSADKSAIVPVADSGRQSDSVRGLIEQAAPLLVAYLRGQPLRCQLRHSEKQPPEAESLLVGGAAACSAHLAGELAP